MSDRIIGILGGMGPEATVDLFREIVRLTPAEKDQDHVPVLIYSNSKIPDRTTAMLEGGEDPMPALVESARILERAGAGILAIPCNTAHYYLPELQKKVGIPILNMILETLQEFVRQLPGARSAGLLAHMGTVRSRIYHAAFKERNVDILVPEDADQVRVSGAIQDVKAGRHGAKTQDTFESIAAKLVSAGAEAAILGCTEIPLAFDQNRVNFPCLNPTTILAQAALKWAQQRD
jgi:aspartate racemase